ncbi:hypothetical protein DPMN_160093 [Dreissena polymorpha]|uniref:Uncharacterized protein n=1 Tax=Dreissena polymorpha TaxID=45954 RepID=A0A9D4ING1_DREPO|nr:hypothetical protein DPMN_160093 [Dreissena polymorpha]
MTQFPTHRDIIGTNLLAKFHEDRTKKCCLGFRVFTRKTAPPPGVHVFQQTGTTLELNQHIIKTNILTNFEVDRDIIGTKLLAKFHEDRKRKMPSRETKVLTKFHEDWTKNVTSRRKMPPGGHVFSPIWTIFKLVREINKTNVLTNFHYDWAKIVTFTLFTRKTAPPSGGHIGHEIFELNRDFIRTKLLTKFHKDRTINVASRVFRNKCGRMDGRTDDGQRPVTKAHLSNQVS